MAHVTIEDINAWTDGVKLEPTQIDADLENQQAEEVIARVASAYNTTTWVNDSSTPGLIKKLISMLYVGWYYQRTYSEDNNVNSYGLMLIAQANLLISGIIAGTTVLLDAPVGSATGSDSPVFYPTDASSIMWPTRDDRSLGHEAFSMGQIW